MSFQGNFSGDLKEIKKALALDPLSITANRNLGATYYFARQYDKALEALHKTLELDPEEFWAHPYIGLTYFEMGRYEEALAELYKVEVSPKTSSVIDSLKGIM